MLFSAFRCEVAKIRPGRLKHLTLSASFKNITGGLGSSEVYKTNRRRRVRRDKKGEKLNVF